MMVTKLIACILTTICLVQASKYYKLPDGRTLIGTTDDAYSILDDCFVRYVNCTDLFMLLELIGCIF